MEHKTHIDCACSSCSLQIISDIDEHQEQTLYLAMFYFGKQKRKFWRRAKYAWRVITKDQVYNDQLILNPDESRKLRDFLNDHVK